MELCRICLGNTDLSDIFDRDENIATNIMLFASVQVIKGDTLPQYICKLCTVELDICLSFKNKCELSYQALSNSRTKVETVLINSPDTEVVIKSDTASIFDNNQFSQDNLIIDCPQCDLQFPSLNLYNVHIKKCKYKCIICNLHFGYKKKFSHHLKSEHGAVLDTKKLKQCEVCGKNFQYNVELSRHMLTHSGVKPFECDQCDKKFSSKAGLNKHIAKHNGIRKFPCPMCTKKFVHKSNLHEHIKVHTNERKHRCHICTKTFKARRTLILHIKIHNNERDFPCSDCDKAFTNKFDLIRHEKRHKLKQGSVNEPNNSTLMVKKEVGNNKWQCELCGKFCRSLSELQKHIRVHTGETPFACIYCEKSFKNTSSLNCHIRIHTQDKPHLCKYCGKGFVQTSNLRTHERIHSPIKPYNCDSCTTSFNRKRDYLRHSEKCIKSLNICDSYMEINV